MWGAIAGAVIGGVMNNRSASAAQAANQQATAAQLRAAREAAGLYRPYTNLGQAALPGVQQDATAAGMGQNIDQIMQGQGFQGLIQQRQQAAEQALAQAGLRRSGMAARSAAAIPAELALQLEGELARRRQGMLNTGLSGVHGQAAGLTQGGQAQAAGALGAAQITAQQNQNTANMWGQVLGGLGSYFGAGAPK